jgi:hypothetical protein
MEQLVGAPPCTWLNETFSLRPVGGCFTHDSDASRCRASRVRLKICSHNGVECRRSNISCAPGHLSCPSNIQEYCLLPLAGRRADGRTRATRSSELQSRIDALFSQYRRGMEALDDGQLAGALHPLERCEVLGLPCDCATPPLSNATMALAAQHGCWLAGRSHARVAHGPACWPSEESLRVRPALLRRFPSPHRGLGAPPAAASLATALHACARHALQRAAARRKRTVPPPSKHSAHGAVDGAPPRARSTTAPCRVLFFGDSLASDTHQAASCDALRAGEMPAGLSYMSHHGVTPGHVPKSKGSAHEGFKQLHRKLDDWAATGGGVAVASIGAHYNNDPRGGTPAGGAGGAARGDGAIVREAFDMNDRAAYGGHLKALFGILDHYAQVCVGITQRVSARIHAD